MFTTLSAEDLALDVTFSETVALAKDAGYDAVDLPMEELVAGGWDAARVAESLAAAGLRAGGWWLPVEFREDRDTFEAGMRTLGPASALARAVGASRCNTWMWPFSDTLDYASNFELHVERLKPVAAMLGEHGCVLGLEYVGPKTMRDGHPHEFVSTMAETFELIGRIGEPNVGVLLDCWQWYTSHGTPADLDALEPGDVTYVHLNDAPAGLDPDEQIDDQRMLPGATGVVDVSVFVATLRRLEYDGPVAAEPYNAELNALAPGPRARVARESLTATLHAAEPTTTDA
jgi:sugar phosphate isomerase/epimerase